MSGLFAPAAHSGTACHIHAPVDANLAAESAPRIIGPFPGAADCERERTLRFGDLGRCHCSASFTPERLGAFVDAPMGGPAPGAAPGSAPLP